MKKLISILAVAFCFAAFAGTTPQYAISVNAVAPLGGQSWETAAQYIVHVEGSGSLWIRDDITSWYESKDLNTTLNMTEGNYGIIENGELVASKYATKDFTYSNGTVEVSSKGYFITNFSGEKDIYFWVSTGSNLIGMSNGYVYDPNGEISEMKEVDIASRGFDSGADLPTGIERMNFGFKDDSVSEFIFIGSNTYYDADIGGTPLPSTMISAIILGIGAISFTKKKEKK